MLTNKLAESFDKQFKKSEVLRLASDLIKINSENPPCDMQEIARYVTELLKSNGIGVEKKESAKGMVNLVARLGKPPYLVLNGHMDTVPIGLRDSWKCDPLSGEIKGGVLYGRGASDMKGGLAGILHAFILASRYEERFDSGLLLMAVPDEESGGQNGTEWLLQNTGIAKETSAALIAEPTDIDNIEIGQKGSLWLKLRSVGESAHGSLSPHVGKNAIFQLFDALEDFKSITHQTAETDESLRCVIEESKRRVIQTIKVPKASRSIDHISLNVGKFNGGNKVNMVPDLAEAELDIRIPIGMTVESVKGMLEKKLRDHTGISMEVVVGTNPNSTSPDAKIAKTVESNVERVIGRTPSKTFQWAASDARYFRYRKIETVQYGPANAKGIHSYNESVKTADIVSATLAYLGTISDYVN